MSIVPLAVEDYEEFVCDCDQLSRLDHPARVTQAARFTCLISRHHDHPRNLSACACSFDFFFHDGSTEVKMMYSGHINGFYFQSDASYALKTTIY